MDATTFKYEVCPLPKELDEKADEYTFFGLRDELIGFVRHFRFLNVQFLHQHVVIASSGGPVVRYVSVIVTGLVGVRLRSCTSIYRS